MLLLSSPVLGLFFIDTWTQSPSIDKEMKAIRLDISLFGRGPSYNRWSERIIRRMLVTLFDINKDYLSVFPNTPDLYESGVIYCRENKSENWQAIPGILESGRGDCEDLACWRAAELVKQGIDAKPFLKAGKRNKLLFHILVQLPNGKFEDPSKLLGMGDPRIEAICQRNQRKRRQWA